MLTVHSALRICPLCSWRVRNFEQSVIYLFLSLVCLRSGEIIFLVVVLFRILQLYHTSKYRVIGPTKFRKCCLLWSKTTSICIVWPASLIGVSTESNSCSEGSRIHFMIKRIVKAPEWFWLCRPWPSLDVSVPAGCVTLRGWMLRAVDLLGIPCCYWSILQEAVNQLAASLHLYLDSYECAEWQCKFAISGSGTVMLTVSGLRKLCCCKNKASTKTRPVLVNYINHTITQ